MYNLHEMLAIKNIEKVALELWNSEYDVSGSMMECSSAFKILKDHDFTCEFDYELYYRFSNSAQCRLPKKQ